MRRHPGPRLTLRLLGVVCVALELGLLLLLLTWLRDGWIPRLCRCWWLRLLWDLRPKMVQSLV